MQDPFSTFHTDMFAAEKINGFDVNAQLIGGKFVYRISLDGHYSVGSWQIDYATEPYNVPVLALYRAFIQRQDFKDWNAKAHQIAYAKLADALALRIKQYRATADEWEEYLENDLVVVDRD